MAVSVSDVKLKSAKPEEKLYRIPVGENVYLDVLPNGRKVWRMRYLKPPAKKPAIYTFGDYPNSPLKAINGLAKIVKEWEWVKQGKNLTVSGLFCVHRCIHLSYVQAFPITIGASIQTELR